MHVLVHITGETYARCLLNVRLTGDIIFESVLELHVRNHLRKVKGIERQIAHYE